MGKYTPQVRDSLLVLVVGENQIRRTSEVRMAKFEIIVRILHGCIASFEKVGHGRLDDKGA